MSSVAVVEWVSSILERPSLIPTELHVVPTFFSFFCFSLSRARESCYQTVCEDSHVSK